jgi:hypothetical protein
MVRRTLEEKMKWLFQVGKGCRNMHFLKRDSPGPSNAWNCLTSRAIVLIFVSVPCYGSHSFILFVLLTLAFVVLIAIHREAFTRESDLYGSDYSNTTGYRIFSCCKPLKCLTRPVVLLFFCDDLKPTNNFVLTSQKHGHDS